MIVLSTCIRPGEAIGRTVNPSGNGGHREYVVSSAASTTRTSRRAIVDDRSLERDPRHDLGRAIAGSSAPSEALQRNESTRGANFCAMQVLWTSRGSASAGDDLG